MHHALISFSDQRGEDVFADALAPEMVTAITPRMVGGVQIDPMILGAAGEMVNAFSDAASLEREASLEAADVNATGPLKIDLWFQC